MFPLTATSDSLDFFKTGYIEFDIKTYPEIYAIERDSYLGGFSGVFSSFMEYGISIDINSSYPASMHNYMPYEPIYSKRFKSYIRTYENPYINDSCKDYNDNFSFVNTNLYLVKFFFDATTKYPSISLKIDGKLSNNQIRTEKTWIWGIQLNLAYKR